MLNGLCDEFAVVEVYSEWCGTCKSVVPTFRRIRADKDDEQALLFLTVGLQSMGTQRLAHEQCVHACLAPTRKGLHACAPHWHA